MYVVYNHTVYKNVHCRKVKPLPAKCLKLAILFFCYSIVNNGVLNFVQSSSKPKPGPFGGFFLVLGSIEVLVFSSRNFAMLTLL